MSSQQENPTFKVIRSEKESGVVFDDSNHNKYPLRVYNLKRSKSSFPSTSSLYVYAYSGDVKVKVNGDIVTMHKGHFGSFSSKDLVIFSGEGAFVIEVLHTEGIYPDTKFSAYNQIVLGIEKTGRLKYIDGCTDTLLIPPVKMGDPCMNHLHFPEGIDQTPHTHPSHRIGMVVKGSGQCVTPFGNLDLEVGMIFIIKEGDGETKSTGLDGRLYPNGTHSFKTEGDELDVIAFHPDSDFGATDVDHPMINRTIVNGVSASKLDNIRTK